MKVMERKDIETFFCNLCDLRVDLCTCKEYRDQGCWDCGPNCQINKRRKAKEEVGKLLNELHFIPKMRPDKMIEETEQTSPCCGAKINMVMKSRRISGILEVAPEYCFCSQCNLMYHLP